MLLVFRTVLDPGPELFSALIIEAFSEIRWRHHLIGILRKDSMDYLALLEVSRDNRTGARFHLAHCSLAQVEAQSAFSSFGIRAMTGVAMLSQKGLDVPAEVGRSSNCRKGQAGEYDALDGSRLEKRHDMNLTSGSSGERENRHWIG